MIVDGQETSMIDNLRAKADASEEGTLETSQAEPDPEPEPEPYEEPLQALPSASEPEPEVIPAEPREGATVSAEEYVPNRVFKVHDQELEFDEFLNPLLTNPENEKKVRDLLERAHGLDHVKQDRQALREDNQRLMAATKEFDEVKGDLQKLGHYLQNGDLESFLESHEITEDQVLRYAMLKLQQREDPNLKAQYDHARHTQNEQYTLSQENRRLQEQVNQSAYAQKQNELSYALNDPNVQTAEQQYNQRMGADAFRQEVIARGSRHYQTTRQDLSARDAVNQVLQVMGYAPSQATNQPTNQPYNAPQPNGANAQAPMPGQQTGQPRVIPNIRGRAATPVRKIPKSIQELRDLSNQMNS